MVKSILTIGLLYLSAQCAAHFFSGNDLVRNMRDWEAVIDKANDVSYTRAGSYSGFVAGVYDSFESSHIICPKDRTTRGQINAVVAKFLKVNPERWGEPAVNLILGALQDAFPCSS
jgi:Rap1a immunity proteins